MATYRVARAPLRLSFAGGGTDVDVYSSRWGGLVLSVAINRYATVRASTDCQPGFMSYPADETNTILLESIAGSRKVYMESRIDVLPRSGLGASGAAVVAAIASLDGKMPTPSDAHNAETKAGTSAGRQDYIPAIFGGMNTVSFKGEELVRTPVEIPLETKYTLETAISLIYIHPRSNSSSQIMADEIRRITSGDQQIIRVLHKQRELAHRAWLALTAGDVEAFGEILDEAWQIKKLQSPWVTNDVIDGVYSIARKAGALGGKLSGAGGGGYLMLFSPGREGAVADALRSLGLRPESIIFDWNGLTIWEENR